MVWTHPKKIHEKHMTYEEFVEIAGGHQVTSGSSTLSECGLSVSWNTGGASGGSCWGDDPVEYTTNETQPDFEKLDDLLMLTCPNLPFHIYRDLCDICIQHSDYTYREYYGNYSEYSMVWVDLKNLYEFLKDQKQI
jgi:hypothetical protein